MPSWRGRFEVVVDVLVAVLAEVVTEPVVLEEVLVQRLSSIKGRRRSGAQEVRSYTAGSAILRRKPEAGYLVPTVGIRTLFVLVLVLVRKSFSAEGRRRSRIEVGTISFYIVSSAMIWRSRRVD